MRRHISLLETGCECVESGPHAVSGRHDPPEPGVGPFDRRDVLGAGADSMRHLVRIPEITHDDRLASRSETGEGVEHRGGGCPHGVQTDAVDTDDDDTACEGRGRSHPEDRRPMRTCQARKVGAKIGVVVGAFDPPLGSTVNPTIAVESRLPVTSCWTVPDVEPNVPAETGLPDPSMSHSW